MPTLAECYKLLNVSPTASEKQVRQAYLRLVKQWHPDAVHNRNNPDASQKFQEIQIAYEMLKQQGEVTSEPTPQAKPQSSGATVSSKISAESLYQSASELGKKGEYKAAIEELSRAIRIDPNYALAYRYRGHLHSMQGLEYQAESDFSKAHILETQGKSNNVADLQQNARSYAREYGRSPYGKKRQSVTTSSHTKLGFWTIAGIIGATILVFFMFQNSSQRSPQRSPQPLFDSESI